MMVRSIIAAHPSTKREVDAHRHETLHVSECFADTIQGENLVGFPSVFLRLQGCTLNCSWCDTEDVWRHGNPYTVDEIIDIWQQSGVLDRLRRGHHLILTGGSPLRQQRSLIRLLDALKEIHIVPFVEVENEVTIKPLPEMIDYVDIWNNSPKLANSDMHIAARYRPELIKFMAQLDESYFKFVITGTSDWDEIQQLFLDTGLIDREQIVLMPEGTTRSQLISRYESLVELACKHSVRMCDRMHITIWQEKTGV